MFDRKAYQREYSKRRYQALTKAERRSRNSSKTLKKAKAKYRSNPINKAKENASCRAWYKNNKEYKNTYGRLHKYGLTKAEYDNLKVSQKYVCALCSEVPKPYKSKDGFVIDHDHITGKFRGLLCHECNVAIGLLKDSPEKCELAAKYLRRTKNEV